MAWKSLVAVLMKTGSPDYSVNLMQLVLEECVKAHRPA
jgi:hypothetical protein